MKIGRIRPKSGGELRLLPSIQERVSAHAMRSLLQSVNQIRDLFGDDLAGYVLIPWSANGDHFDSFIEAWSSYPRLNDLPTWAAEVIRRDLAEREARELIE